jgi:TubC N-terminal docking domain
MTAKELVFELASLGMHLTVREGNLVVSPSSLLKPDMKQALIAAKPEILTLLSRTSPTWLRLEASVARACRARGQTDLDRMGILQQCRTLDECHQAELVELFDQEAATWGGING